MDDSQALIGLLDRLAEARHVGAAGARPTPRFGVGYEADLGRTRLGAAALRVDGLHVLQARTSRSSQRVLGQRRSELLEARIRRTFALMNEYRTALESRADSHWLGILLHAVCQDATFTFNAAAKLRPETAEFSADKTRCLSDLEQLLRTMRDQQLPSDYELTHAMDALIVHLVQLTSR